MPLGIRAMLQVMVDDVPQKIALPANRGFRVDGRRRCGGRRAHGVILVCDHNVAA